MFWFRQGLCLLPLFVVVWGSSTFIINYIIAVFRGDVDIIFPYISDTGAYPPESCIFGLMTFISSCAGIATIYARYKYVEKLIEEHKPIKPCLNKVTLWIGILSCFGMCVVATFQETAVTQVHDVGAFLFFVSGVVYICLQCVISFKDSSSKTVRGFRLLFTILAVLALFPTVICAIYVRQATLHRHTYDKDYKYHMCSAVCEWIVAFSFIFFFLTYINDFKMFTLKVMTEYDG